MMTPEEAADRARFVIERDKDKTFTEIRTQTLRALLAGYEAAVKDLRISNKCITCAYNTGAEGKDFCNNKDSGIQFVNRKEDRYIRCECLGWQWRGPEPGGEESE